MHRLNLIVKKNQTNWLRDIQQEWNKCGDNDRQKREWNCLTQNKGD